MPDHSCQPWTALEVFVSCELRAVSSGVHRMSQWGGGAF